MEINHHCFEFTALLVGVFFTVSSCYNIGVISSGFPVLEISDNDFIKRAVSSMADVPESMKDAIHGVKMGVSSDICDNAKDGLDIDWDGSPVNYTCYHPKNRLPVLKYSKAVEECMPDADRFFAKHVCLQEKIRYDDFIPTLGNHRPLWPVYGEYTFVPPQRWLHNLEHGAIVMLYHPCAEPLEINRLKKLVKGCLRRHIITPYTYLPADKPFALVAWGCKLQMNHVDENTVKNFIKARALRGPEGSLAKQGQYRYKLLEIASPPKGSNFRDIKLCPS